MIETTVTIIELDGSLEPQTIDPSKTANLPDKYVGKEYSVIRDCIPEGDVKHTNYLEYLGEAWKSHYGIVFSPDILWHIVLNEIAQVIKGNPEQYRKLFTSSDDKQLILVKTMDSELIDLNLIMDGLKSLIPSNANLFLPEFTTSTATSLLAFMATFADAMSPFYNYGMYMCGITKVKVLGETEDWETIERNLKSLGDLFETSDVVDYFTRVGNLVDTIRTSSGEDSASFWKDIFSLERCGSGGQVEVKGWINKLFMKTPRPAYINNYPTCVSYVAYRNITTNQDFELVYGLFSSKLEHGFLEPEFGYLITEKK